MSTLSGDLDSIALKTLEKDPSRRYGTLSELAADIARYLQDEPILARPASASYRLGKYVSRHRIAAAVSVAFALLLMGFTFLQTVQLRRTTRERDRANRIAGFMTDMFTVANPSEARGNSITAREILDKSSAEIESGLSQDPELQSQLMDFMGKVYWHLGLLPQSSELLSRAVDIRRRVLGLQHRDTMDSMNSLAKTLADQGKLQDAQKLFELVFATSRRVLGPSHHTTLTAMNNIALDLNDQGKYADAEKMQRELIAIERRKSGLENLDTLTYMSNLAITLKNEGRFANAETTNREVLEKRRRILGVDHPDTLRSAANLALNLAQEHKSPEEAEALIRETLAAQRRILGPDHPDTLESMNTLGLALNEEHKLSDEETVVREELARYTNVLGSENRKTLIAMNNLAALLDNQKNMTRPRSYSAASSKFSCATGVPRNTRHCWPRLISPRCYRIRNISWKRKNWARKPWKSSDESWVTKMP